MYPSLFDELEKIAEESKQAGLRTGLKTLFTGRVPLFHGTSASRAAQIAKGGLIPQKASGITDLFPDIARREANMGFTSLSPTNARGYAVQQSGLDRLDRLRDGVARIASNPRFPRFLDPAVQKVDALTHPTHIVGRTLVAGLGDLPGGKSVVRMDVPRQMIKEHVGVGQELHSSVGQGAQAAMSRVYGNTLGPRVYANNFTSHVPLIGGVPAQYVRNSPHYQGVSMAELKQHARNVVSDPIGVGKDVLRSTLGRAHRPGTLLAQGAPGARPSW